jgi:Zn-dependent M28 family amino/carboxypeptidase
VAIAAGAAKIIADLPKRPSRTIRVVLFGAEEIVGAGKPYARGLADKAKDIVIAGESDFGAGRIYAASLPKGAAASPFGRKLAAALLPLGIDLSLAPAPFGGADLDGLIDRGVPFLQFSQDGLSYFDIHHTADDTFDKVDPAALAQNVAAWACLAWLAADSDVDFRALTAEANAQ